MSFVTTDKLETTSSGQNELFYSSAAATPQFYEANQNNQNNENQDENDGVGGHSTTPVTTVEPIGISQATDQTGDAGYSHNPQNTHTYNPENGTTSSEQTTLYMNDSNAHWTTEREQIGANSDLKHVRFVPQNPELCQSMNTSLASSVYKASKAEVCAYLCSIETSCYCFYIKESCGECYVFSETQYTGFRNQSHAEPSISQPFECFCRQSQ